MALRYIWRAYRLPHILNHGHAHEGNRGKRMVPSIFHALVVPLLCIACLEQMFHRKNRPKVFGHFLWGAILKFLCRNIIRVVSIGAFYGRKYAQNAFANPNGGAYNIPPDPIAGGVAPSQEPHPYSRPLNPRGTLARHGDVRPPNFLEKPIISPSRTDAKSIICLLYTSDAADE